MSVATVDRIVPDYSDFQIETAPAPKQASARAGEVPFSLATTPAELDATISSAVTTQVIFRSPRNRVADFAMRLRDVRYVRGGHDPVTGFDCSGFTHYVYNKTYGVDLPYDAPGQYRDGKTIPRERMRTGDLVFFQVGKHITHVGIYSRTGVSSTRRGLARACASTVSTAPIGPSISPAPSVPKSFPKSGGLRHRARPQVAPALCPRLALYLLARPVDTAQMESVTGIRRSIFAAACAGLLLAACASPQATLHGDAAHPAAQRWLRTELYFGVGPVDDADGAANEKRWREFSTAKSRRAFPTDSRSLMSTANGVRRATATSSACIRRSC